MTECFSPAERTLITTAATLFVSGYLVAALLLIIGFARRVIAENAESDYNRELHQRRTHDTTTTNPNR